jgi:hypothetical protein
MTMAAQRRVTSFVAMATAVAIVLAPAAAGARTSPAPQTPAPPASNTTPSAPATVPITEADFNRIKKALSSEPALNINDDQLRYYVQVLAKQPSFAEFVKGFDLMNGPTRRGNPMSHQEFLQMVTPKELYSSSTITAVEVLQSALTNWIGQTLIRRAISELKEAKSDREVQEIRDRISRELAALQGG